MTYESTRAGLDALLAAGWQAGAFASYAIEWENLNSIDHNKRTEAFLTAQIKWRDASEASLEETPLTRRDGEFLIHIHVEAGKGTKLALQMADVLDGILKYKVAAGARLLAPRLLDAVPLKGWHVWPISTSFHFTS